MQKLNLLYFPFIIVIAFKKLSKVALNLELSRACSDDSLISHSSTDLHSCTFLSHKESESVQNERSAREFLWSALSARKAELCCNTKREREKHTHTWKKGKWVKEAKATKPTSKMRVWSVRISTIRQIYL